MGPLVDLVSEGDEEAEHKEEGVDVVPGTDILVGLVPHHVGHAHQGRESDQAVVSVGFNEVVSSDGKRVHMVLSEWSDEGLLGGGGGKTQ